MGRVPMALLLVVCLGALALTAEAARTHEKFAAMTYYEETNETKVVAPKEENATTTIPDRYPNGYPGAKHRYNPTTEQYESTEAEAVGIPEAGRYVNGYYDQAHKYAQESTIPVVKSTGSSYTVVDSKDTSVTPATTIPDRYPAGYYAKPLPTNPTTVGPAGGRYPNGYYASSQVTGSAQQHNGMSYSSQQTMNPTERYPHGYFPQSEYAGKTYPAVMSTAKPVSYNSYTGNFETQPYPNVGVPYVEGGAGCRTAFWAANVKHWPSFFTVKSTVGDAFGTKAKEVFGSTTIWQALLTYGSDGYKELMRSGCTALLNSYTRGRFTIEHMKVIEEFNAALISKEAAKAQALVFETANVESISAGNACV